MNVKAFLLELLKNPRMLGRHGTCYYLASRFLVFRNVSSCESDILAENCYNIGSTMRSEYIKGKHTFDLSSGKMTKDRIELVKFVIESIENKTIEQLVDLKFELVTCDC